MMHMNRAEMEATRIFISDLSCHRDNRRKFKQLREILSARDLTGRISDLLAKRIINKEEERYLLRRLRIN